MKKKYLLCIYLIIIQSFLIAHPHLFIKPVVSIINNEENIVKGIEIEWEWDEWWSRDVIEDCDLDKNGVFSPKETDIVYKNFFIGIKDFNFFMEIYVNKKRIGIKNVVDFSVKIESNIVTYKFTIPLNISEKRNNFKIIFNDETIYTSFAEISINYKDNNKNYKNEKIGTHSYYGREIVFDYEN